MQLLNPIWLWGLSGLAIPIAIHLLSRKTGTVIKFGSVRHLEDTTTRRFKRIRLNEYLLLALRCLLIVLLVLLVSELNFSRKRHEQYWLLIENGLKNEKEFAAIVDSLGKSGFQQRSLSRNFPVLKDTLIDSEKINYWNIIEELKTQSVKQAVVLSKSYAEGFNGKRVGLPDHVRWISKTPDSNQFTLGAVRYSPDSMKLRLGKSGPRKTNYEFKNVASDQVKLSDEFALDSTLITSPSTISVTIFNDSSFTLDKNIFVGALQAVDKFTTDSIVIKSYSTLAFDPDIKSDFIIVLSEKPLHVQNANSIIFTKNGYHDQLFSEVGTRNNHHAWILTERLTTEVALQENLAVALASILLPEQGYARRAAVLDKRVLPDQLMRTATDTFPIRQSASVGLKGSQGNLIMLFLTFLLLERWLAFKRNQ